MWWKMIDSQKVNYLYNTAKVFDKKNIKSERKLRDKLKYICLKYLDRDYNSNISSNFLSHEHYSEDTPVFNLIEERNQQDNYLITMQEIATFINDLKNKKEIKNKKQNYFYDNDYNKYKTDSIEYVKEAIVELSDIDISILGIADEETFKEYFEEQEIYIDIHKDFEKYRLKDILKDNKFDERQLKLKDFDKNLELPSIINKNILDKHQLAKTLVIEGISGSGKTVLAQRVAYEVSKQYSFYIDFDIDIDIDIDSIHYNYKSYQKKIEIFLNQLMEAKGVLVLDNIQASPKSKKITEDFVKKSLKLEIPIIIVVQYELVRYNKKIKNFFENFIEDIDYNLNISQFNIIYIAEGTNYLKTRISLTRNLIQYFFNIELINNLPTKNQIYNIERKFHASLFYLKKAIEFKEGLENINIDIAKEEILKQYSILHNNPNDYFGFKFLFTLISRKNGKFIIKKEIFLKELADERVIIDELVEKKMIFKLLDKENVILQFHHKLIPNILFDKLRKDQDVRLLLYSSVNYFYLLDKLYFQYLLYTISLLKRDDNLFVKTIQLLLKNNFDIKSILSLKMVNVKIFFDKDNNIINFLINEKEKIFSRQMLLEQKPQNDYSPVNFLDMSDDKLKKKSTYSIIELIYSFNSINEYNSINFFVDMFCARDKLDFHTLEIAIFFKSNIKKFKIQTKYIEILDNIIFSNKDILLSYFSTQDTIYRVLYAIYLNDEKIKEFINENLKTILNKYESSYNSIILLLILSSYDLKSSRHKELIGVFTRKITDNSLKKHTENIHESKLITFINEIVKINKYTNQDYSFSILEKILNFFYNYQNIKYLISFLNEFIFNNMENFIQFYQHIPIKYKTYLTEVINEYIVVPSNIILTTTSYEIFTLNKLSKFNDRYIEYILKQDDVIQTLSLGSTKYFLLILDRLFYTNNQFFHELFMDYCNIIQDFMFVNCNSHLKIYFHYHAVEFTSSLYKYNYTSYILDFPYSDKNFRTSLILTQSEKLGILDNYDISRIKNFILFLDYFKQFDKDPEIEKLLSFFVGYITLQHKMQKNNDFIVFVSIFKYLNLLSNNEINQILKIVLKLKFIKKTLQESDRFLLYYILNLLQYKHIKFFKVIKLEKLFHKLELNHSTTENTYENITIKFMSLKGLLVVSNNKEFIIELKLKKNVINLQSDYKELKEKRLLSEFDTHICDNILKDLHKN